MFELSNLTFVIHFNYGYGFSGFLGFYRFLFGQYGEEEGVTYRCTYIQTDGHTYKQKRQPYVIRREGFGPLGEGVLKGTTSL
jgi:hypothetical protein